MINTAPTRRLAALLVLLSLVLLRDRRVSVRLKARVRVPA